MGEALTFFVIAGESSGDKLGAALMRGLRSEHGNNINFVGVGGPLMIEQGLDTIFPLDELSVMGIAEVLPKLVGLLQRIKETAAAVASVNPTALITIDSPDFCFRVAKRAKQDNPALRVVHYVAPSVWAWRPKRAAMMAAYVDHVLALLPFEPPYMEAEGMSCDFVGHPIISEKQATQEQVAHFRSEIGVARDARVLAVLPGSRASEVSRIGPVFRQVCERIQNDFPDIELVIPSVAARVDMITEMFDGLDVKVLDPRKGDPEDAENRKRACFKTSEVALAASGTVSLELAAAETPMVIAYKTHWLTGLIKKRLVNVSSATLVNLLTESQTVPEFLLEDCTVEKIYPALKELLEVPEMRKSQLEMSAEAMRLLGKDSATENRAAQSVLQFLDIR